MLVYQRALRKKAAYLEIYLSCPYIQSAQAECTAVTSLELGDTKKYTKEDIAETVLKKGEPFMCVLKFKLDEFVSYLFKTKYV